jgi:hypothetical protein
MSPVERNPSDAWQEVIAAALHERARADTIKGRAAWAAAELAAKFVLPVAVEVYKLRTDPGTDPADLKRAEKSLRSHKRRAAICWKHARDVERPSAPVAAAKQDAKILKLFK